MDALEAFQLFHGAGNAAHQVADIELKGFERIHLKKGESKQVTFTITPELLKFYNYDIQYVYEPGEFHVMIGPNSRDVKLSLIHI